MGPVKGVSGDYSMKTADNMGLELRISAGVIHLRSSGTCMTWKVTEIDKNAYGKSLSERRGRP